MVREVRCKLTVQYYRLVSFVSGIGVSLGREDRSISFTLFSVLS